jgi:hypothetical protein
MGYLFDALGDTGNDYCGGRRTYTDAPTVRLVQEGLRELADKAVRGAAGIDRQLANVEPGPIDGVIRPQLTAAITTAQRIAGRECVDGKIDDWLMSALHLQPHLNPKDSTAPPATEIPNPAAPKSPTTVRVGNDDYYGPGFGPDYRPALPPPAKKDDGPGIGTLVVAGVLGGLALRQLVKRGRT